MRLQGTGKANGRRGHETGWPRRFDLTVRSTDLVRISELWRLSLTDKTSQETELGNFAIVGPVRKINTIEIKRLELYGILSAQGAQ